MIPQAKEAAMETPPLDPRQAEAWMREALATAHEALDHARTLALVGRAQTVAQPPQGEDRDHLPLGLDLRARRGETTTLTWSW